LLDDLKPYVPEIIMPEKPFADSFEYDLSFFYKKYRDRIESKDWFFKLIKSSKHVEARFTTAANSYMIYLIANQYFNQVYYVEHNPAFADYSKPADNCLYYFVEGLYSSSRRYDEVITYTETFGTLNLGYTHVVNDLITTIEDYLKDKKTGVVRYGVKQRISNTYPWHGEGQLYRLTTNGNTWDDLYSRNVGDIIRMWKDATGGSGDYIPEFNKRFKAYDELNAMEQSFSEQQWARIPGVHTGYLDNLGLFVPFNFIVDDYWTQHWYNAMPDDCPRLWIVCYLAKWEDPSQEQMQAWLEVAPQDPWQVINSIESFAHEMKENNKFLFPVYMAFGREGEVNWRHATWEQTDKAARFNQYYDDFPINIKPIDKDENKFWFDLLRDCGALSEKVIPSEYQVPERPIVQPDTPSPMSGGLDDDGSFTVRW
jgi:hypothetical protein